MEAPDDGDGWRYLRIHQNGKNASSQTHYLSLSGFELYGTVVNVVEEALGKFYNLNKFYFFVLTYIV